MTCAHSASEHTRRILVSGLTLVPRANRGAIVSQRHSRSWCVCPFEDISRIHLYYKYHRSALEA